MFTGSLAHEPRYCHYSSLGRQSRDRESNGCTTNEESELIMDEQTLVVLVMGSAVVAFAFFGSYMAARQQIQEEKSKAHQHD
jgi:hypothetical protein